MSHPSAATRQRVPAHFAGNGPFLEVGAWIKVAGNFLASFKANRHLFLLWMEELMYDRMRKIFPIPDLMNG
jgi:hypothetical protein